MIRRNLPSASHIYLDVLLWTLYSLSQLAAQKKKNSTMNESDRRRAPEESSHNSFLRCIISHYGG
jgi:hypothetical protein